MGFFGSLINFATGNKENFEQENQVYTDVVQKIEQIYQELENMVNQDYIQSSEYLIEKEKNDFMKLENYIIVLKRKLVTENNDMERRKIISEIQNIQVALEALIEKLKDNLLNRKNSIELMTKISELNAILLRYANLVAFQNINVRKEPWTMAKLENLKNQISNRRVEIIPKMSYYGSRK